MVYMHIEMLFSYEKEGKLAICSNRNLANCYNRTLRPFMLSEINQTPTDKYCMISLMWGI